MAIWLPLLLVILVFSCAHKAGAGRRCDLGLVVVMLSVALIATQFSDPPTAHLAVVQPILNSKPPVRDPLAGGNMFVKKSVVKSSSVNLSQLKRYSVWSSDSIGWKGC